MLTFAEAVCGNVSGTLFCTTIESILIMKNTKRKKIMSIMGIIMSCGLFSSGRRSIFIMRTPDERQIHRRRIFYAGNDGIGAMRQPCVDRKR